MRLFADALGGAQVSLAEKALRPSLSAGYRPVTLKLDLEMPWSVESTNAPGCFPNLPILGARSLRRRHLRRRSCCSRIGYSQRLVGSCSYQSLLGLADRMQSIPPRLKQLEKQLAELDGDESMLLTEFDGFLAGILVFLI